MSTYNIDWSWGTNNVIDFDAKQDKLNFNWMSSSQFTMEEKDGSVIISIAGNNQTYTLENCTIADLSSANVIANDSSTQSLFNGANPDTPVDPVTPVNPVDPVTPVNPVDPVTPVNPVDPVSPVTPTDHVLNIAYDYGSDNHVAFDAKTDKINFGWMQSSEFSIAEKDGSVVISMGDMHESYTLDNVKLSDLSMNNIDANDSSAISAWQTALNADPSAPPVIPDIDPNAPAMPTAYEFAPYVDMTAWPSPDLVSITSESGIKDFTLAFMVSDNNGGLSWGGTISMDQDKQEGSRYTFQQEIEAVQNAGGDVTLSFGGANGVEAALQAKDAQSLADLYQTAIDKYHLDSIDFDIEGGALNDKASVEMRNQAIAILEKNNSDLEVSYTLPVLPDGLTQDGVNLLQSAQENGVKLADVNLMAMDYGGAYDTKAGDQLDMAQAAIDAATNTHNQMLSLGITDTKIGLTPMIGMNDDTKEIFTLDDASRLAQYASQNSDVIGRLSMWSLGRDNGDGANAGYVSPNFSSLSQNEYDFSHALMGA
ncbi:chitinase [Pantoea agglomerans]|uniref:chitinase n=1 Tax=Enterobacter agglomerans TaxID=549 RepID=UPI002412EE1F|nr:glycosyl hydrolase family 18 protein [Pantoea agglomerans]